MAADRATRCLPARHAMSAAPVDAKRRRINAIAGVGGVSERTLLRIARLLEEAPELHGELSSRQAVASASLSLLGRCVDTVALPLRGAAARPWPIASPSTCMRFFCESSDSFASMVLAAERACPNSLANPWRMVLYSDELTPGNPLRADNRRKTMIWYWSILEYGRHNLQKVEAWLPLAAIRSSIARQVEGGFCGVLRHLLRALFLGDHGIGAVGITLPVRGPARTNTNIHRERVRERERDGHTDTNTHTHTHTAPQPPPTPPPPPPILPPPQPRRERNRERERDRGVVGRCRTRHSDSS